MKSGHHFHTQVITSSYIWYISRQTHHTRPRQAQNSVANISLVLELGASCSKMHNLSIRICARSLSHITLFSHSESDVIEQLSATESTGVRVPYLRKLRKRLAEKSHLKIHALCIYALYFYKLVSMSDSSLSPSVVFWS